MMESMVVFLALCAVGGVVFTAVIMFLESVDD
jgi:hypothetical protein